MLGILGACALIFAFMPSARNARIERREKEVSSFVERKNGREATSTEISAVVSTNHYLIRGVIAGPAIYIFIPSLNNNIAVLGRLSTVRPGLGGYSIFLVPLPDRESPTSEKAVGMGLIYNNFWRVPDLISAAADIRSNVSVIDEKWSHFDDTNRAKIKKMLGENADVQRKLGKFNALVVDGKQGYLMENWFDVTDLRELLSQLHKAQRNFGR